MASYLITGCSRGLGLALATQLARAPASQVSHVFATARSDKSEALKQLVARSEGRVVMIQLDTVDRASINHAKTQVEGILQGRGLDVLVNNAGVLTWLNDGIENMADLDQTFMTNVSGTHSVTSIFLPLLQQGTQKLVMNISTTLGSFGLARKFDHSKTPSYKITKAALNMLTLQYARSFANRGFRFIAVSPGWLQTDLGGKSADLTVDQGAEAVLKVLREVRLEDNGKFFDIEVPGNSQYPGGEAPW